MSKKVFIGFRNTLVDTNKAIVSIYNQRYEENIDVSEIRYLNIQKDCICLGEAFNGDAEEELRAILQEDEYWNRLEIIRNSSDALIKLKDNGYELYLVVDDAHAKAPQFLGYVKEHFDTVDTIINIQEFKSDDEAFKKETQASAFVDNEVAHLLSSNSELKIVFGKELKGNRNPGFFRLSDWLQAPDYINQVLSK